MARIQHQVYPSINNDLKDWQVDTRVKAVELLYMMLYHSEQDIVMHTEKVLNCLITAARDEEEKVRSWTRKCSVVLGFMLQPDIWVPFMIQRLREDPSSHQILVLAGLVDGTDPYKLSEEQMSELVDILVHEDVCCTREETTLNELGEFSKALIKILCASLKLNKMITEVTSKSKDTDETIIEKAAENTVIQTRKEEATITEITEDEEDAEPLDLNQKLILDGIVKMNLAIISLSSNQATRDQADECRNTLVEMTSDQSLLTLYRSTIPSLLSQFIQNSGTWSSASPQLEMMKTMLSLCGPVVGFFPKTMVMILTQMCNMDSSDPATRLASLMILSRLLLNTSDTLDSQGNNHDDISLSHIDNYLLRNIWSMFGCCSH